MPVTAAAKTANLAPELTRVRALGPLSRSAAVAYVRAPLRLVMQ